MTNSSENNNHEAITKLPVFPNGKGHISYSEIIDWVECSYRHKLKHIDKIDLDSGSIHTAFGTAIHEAAEYFLKNRKLPETKTIQETFKKELHKLPEEAKTKALKQLPEFIENLPDMIGQIPDWTNKTFPNWELVEAEKLLYEEIELQDNVKFKGYIDGVIKVPKKPTKKLLKEYEKKGEKCPPQYEYVVLDWKGQRLTAPILTPTGWTTMGQLKIGTEIIGSNGRSQHVTGIFPLGKREVYRVTLRDGTQIDTTDDHLWKVYTSKSSGGKESNGRFSKVMTTKELMDEKRYLFLPPLSSPVEFDKIFDPKIDPYLLGVLLVDGCLTRGVRISTADFEILESIVNVIPEKVSLKKIGKTKYDYGLTVSQKGFNPRICRNNNPVLDEVRRQGLIGKRSHEKFIPSDYFFMNPKNRLALIQGLMDTDGWVQKGIAKFSTTSDKLAQDLKYLVDSLGGTTFTTTRKKKRNVNEKTEIIVTVRLPKGMNPFRLSRKLDKWNSNPKQDTFRKITKIELLPEKDEMQCIKVSNEDSLYVTNDFTLTHNTSSWGWKPEMKQDFYKRMQLILYKHFFSKTSAVPLDKIKCGFVLIKRTPRKDGNRMELITVSVGQKSIDKALKVLHNMINQVRAGLVMKNRRHCKPFCPYAGTRHCT